MISGIVGFLLSLGGGGIVSRLDMVLVDKKLEDGGRLPSISLLEGEE